MARAKLIEAVGVNKPLCTAPVKLGQADTMTRRGRIWKSNHRGMEPDMCGSRADIMLDGQPRCRSHAGQDALRILLAD